MELGPIHIAVLHRCSQLRTVLRGGSALSFTVKAREGMDEVDVGPLLQGPEDGAAGPLPGKVQGVPAHVGDRQAAGEHRPDVPHLAGDQPQPLVLPVLKRGLKQQLHPQADAQQRLSRRRLPEDRPVHSGAPQLFHRVAEGPHPRQKDVIRPVQFLLVPGDHRLLSDGGQRAFQRKKKQSKRK